MSLNAVYRASQFRQQSGHVARSGSDLEYTVLRLNIEMLKHQRHNKRLRDRLPLSDGDGMIRVSLRVILGGNKLVARHVRHGRQYSFIVDASALQLSFHHAMPLMGKSVVLGLEIRKHCRRNVSTGKSVAAVWLFSPLPQANIKTDNTVLVAHSADRYAASNVVLGLNDLL